jgi:hypothetical protein
MVTDPAPRQPSRRVAFDRSDALRTLELPPEEPLRALAAAIERELLADARAPLERVCAELAARVAGFHSVAAPPVKVLGVRPHRTVDGVCVYEKFGDYDLRSGVIRLWMRTAMRQQTTSVGTLLSTLCHEVCHHLDVVKLAFPHSPHTRGFFHRAAKLYHHVRGTPERELRWIKGGGSTWRLDWQRTMRAP